MDDVERILNKLDALEAAVGGLQVAVARLEERLPAAVAPKSGLARDGGITISGGAVGAALAFLAQHFVK